jgi:hypothetical protein
MCLQCTHFLCPPIELAIIVMNSMQVYVGKFSNYHFVLFNGVGCARGDVVDGFIPWKRTYMGGKTIIVKV